jgi:hypothetical protein
MLQGARRYTIKSIAVPTGPTLNMCIVLLWPQLEPTAYLLPAWCEYMSGGTFRARGKRVRSLFNAHCDRQREWHVFFRSQFLIRDHGPR